MRPVALYWYLLTPESTWGYIWKVTVMTVTVLVISGLIEISFGYNIAGKAAIYGLVGVFLIAPSLALAMRMIQRLHEMQEKLTELAMTDVLTGLGNRRAFMEAATEREVGTVILLDLDHFKRINDTYGHDVGDRVLEAVGEFLRANLRDNDIAARFGGEEFVIYLDGAEPEHTQKIAERLVQGFEFTDGVQSLGVTMSAGIAPFLTPPGLAVSLNQADKVMYEAKAAGRARFRIWNEAGS